MAALNPDHSPQEDLTRCGICKETINEPKALPCLHTFCLECLREWSKTSHESVTCPILACKKTTPMPSDGVDGLPGNVFVSSLIERSPSRGKQVPCVCCHETNNEVLARCLDCNGFLCKKGVDLHRELLLRSHQVTKLEDIKSGEVDLRQVTGKKRPTCSDHEGQQLWFFCKTCGILICRDCTVVHHRNPEHVYVELKSIVAEQRLKIKEKVVAIGSIGKEVDKAMKSTVQAQETLKHNFKQTSKDIDEAVEAIKAHVDRVCKSEKERLMKQQEAAQRLSNTNIETAEKILQTQKMRLQTAQEMANQVLLSGSDYDIASVYTQLDTSLDELCKIEPACVPRDVVRLPEFNADHRIITDFSQIGILGRRVSASEWVLESRFGDKDGPGKQQYGLGISTTPIGDIAVANLHSTTPVKVYSSTGQYKFNLDKQSCYAWNVAVSSAGQFYVTTYNCKYVTMYRSDGHYQSQFAAVSPSGVSSDAEDTHLRGLAINKKGQVLVGNRRLKYISIHDLNGVHITSIQVSFDREYIATTSEGNIIVSPNRRGRGVQILDSKGILQHTINAPEGVSGWHPKGVCCSIYDEICIGNYGEPEGVYCFSSAGVYLGCIIKEINEPRGVALMQNDEKMLVSDGGSCVKIFSRK